MTVHDETLFACSHRKGRYLFVPSYLPCPQEPALATYVRELEALPNCVPRGKFVIMPVTAECGNRMVSGRWRMARKSA
jgi:hypothetical protein